MSSIAGTLLSCVHGRDRRALRHIDKKDLLAAVQFGRKERGYPNRITGEGRWKYTFANIVYITDETSRHEVTSYVLPLEIEKVLVTEEGLRMHKEWQKSLRENHRLCTSHTVLVVDQSGSMKTSDVEDYRHRSDAVFATIALDFVGKSLDSGQALPTNALTLIEFSDTADVTIDREPITNVLFNKLIDKRTSAKPHSHGNYESALKLCERVLALDEGNQDCAILLLFLSDGRPSDHRALGETHEQVFGTKVLELSRKFKKQLTLGTIGFAGEGTDFGVLNEMARQANLGGSMGVFQKSQASAVALSSAVSLLGSQLSQTQTRLTALAASRLVSRGTVRTLETEGFKRFANSGGMSGWISYIQDVKRQEWVAVRGARNGGHWQSHSLVNPGACGVAIRAKTLGRGAERVVFQLREIKRALDGSMELVGTDLVAKESIHVELMEMKRDFHRIFCYTQAKSQDLARQFNEEVIRRASPSQRGKLPLIRFLDCFVYTMYDEEQRGIRGVLVEKMINTEKYVKWNGNEGSVKGVSQQTVALGLFAKGIPQFDDPAVVPDTCKQLGAIVEESEEESDEEFEDLVPMTLPTRSVVSAVEDWNMEDFPQAFSHFTYRRSNRKLLVCDLQGVLDMTRSPPSEL
ncbi:hypothetical protein HDU98_011575 [Podochytrium sp. JEL0797]|nr:hypothetical protein HDU98_011575 [Podochytrium sp. JEL0797]